MSKITDNILEKIKSKHIEPKPRWHFILRQILIWLVTTISIIIGSLSISVIVFRIVNNDWEVLKYINRSSITHAINTLPYIWILILILFVGLAYYNARHTKGAYKYHAYWLVLVSVGISMILGGIFYAVGMGPRVHNVSDRLPYINTMMHDRENFWMDAEKGLIAGEVTHMLSGVGMFEIKDLENDNWIIVPSNEYFPPPKDFIIEEGVMIRIYGEKINEDSFEAIKVLPYQMGPGIRKGGHHDNEACEQFRKCGMK